VSSAAWLLLLLGMHRGAHLLPAAAVRPSGPSHPARCVLIGVCVLCRLRREQRLATASPDDVPKGASAATTRHLNDRFEYYLRNQDDEGSYGLHNFH
jgi:hypothetical protein